MRLAVGAEVTTTQNAGSTDWARESRVNARWGTKGVVIRVSDAHGLCYEVRHSADRYGRWVTAWYEPRELALPDGTPVETKPTRDAFDVLLDGYIL